MDKLSILNTPLGALNTAMPTLTTLNSTWGKLSTGLGTTVSVNKTLNQGTEPIRVNLFSFTQAFRLLAIWAACTEATDATDIDDCRFEVSDGTNTIPLTLGEGTGVELDGITVGSVIGVIDAATAAMMYLKNDEIRIENAAYQGCPVWWETLIVPKTGVTNYVQFVYDSATDSGLDVVMEFSMTWCDLRPAVPSVVTPVE